VSVGHDRRDMGNSGGIEPIVRIRACRTYRKAAHEWLGLLSCKQLYIKR
jgi:hypothetical protein